MKHLLAVLFLAISLQSCNYNVTKSTGDADPANKITAIEPSALITYELVKSNVTAVCLECHVPGGASPQLMSKQDLTTHMSSILSEVSSNRMPMDRPALSDCQKATLKKWYDLGAPDSSEVAVNTLPECADATRNPPSTEPPVVDKPPVTEVMITYELINKATAAVCLNCHSAGQKKPDLSTQDGYRKHAGEVLISVMTNKMPRRAPPLDACQKATLQKWLHLGAPTETSVPVSSLPECAPVAPPVVVEPPPVTEKMITFDLIKTETTAVCLRCHDAGKRSPDLSTKEKIVSSSASVMSSILANRMPRGTKPLTDCQKATLKKWFELGAPEESTVAVSSLPECTSL